LDVAHVVLETDGEFGQRGFIEFVDDFFFVGRVVAIVLLRVVLEIRISRFVFLRLRGGCRSGGRLCFGRLILERHCGFDVCLFGKPEVMV
jgi:hypothetical protein